MPPNSITMPHPGYNLLYTFDKSPTCDEFENFADCALAIRDVAAPIEPNESVEAEIGQLRLVLLEKPTEEQRTRLRAFPVLRERRGTNLEPVTIDAEVWKNEPFDPAKNPPCEPQYDKDLPGVLKSTPGILTRKPDDPSLSTILMRAGVLHAQDVLAESKQSLREVVVAVIDSGFATGTTSDPLPDFVGPVEKVHLRRPRKDVSFESSKRHGTLMTHVIAQILKGMPVRLRRIQIPDNSQSSAYVAPADLAVAIAHAAAPRNEQPAADIVVVAMSTGQWGTPDYLDAIIGEAARTRRNGKGAILVCSTGSPDDNQKAIATTGCDITIPMEQREALCRSEARRSAAHGADEVGAHPDVILVGPCDIAGRWLRRFYDPPVDDRIPDRQMIFTGIKGRMGPSVTVTAPGAMTYLDSAKTKFDESSQSSAIVAGIIGQMLLANPTLEAAEVRRLLRQTTMMPDAVDTPYGLESANLSAFSSDGHNFKIGSGMVNGLGAVLAARDPICQMLLQVSVPLPPSAELNGFMAAPALLIARWFDHWVRMHAPMAEEYRRHRYALTRLILVSWPLREEVGWLVRHLLAIFTHDGSHAWYLPQSNHGALLRRLRRLVTTLRRELEREGERFGIPVETGRTWVNLLDERVGIVDDVTIQRFLRGAFLGFGVDLTHSKSSMDTVLAPYTVLGRYELEPDFVA